MEKSPYFALEDKTVFVAGGAGDIGRTIVTAFAEQHSKVAIADLNLQSAERHAQKLTGARVTAVGLDVTSDASIRKAVDLTVDRFGPIDILVNVAGVLCRKSFFETTRQDFETGFAVNVMGMFLVSREVAAHMAPRGQGAIINISSMNARLAVENRCVYAATKAAVNMLTQSMAVELSPLGITVNAVAPGIVDSQMARVRLNTPALLKAFTDAIPLKQLTMPEDVAYAVLFLASPYARKISGEILLVDGALTARMALPQPKETAWRPQA